MRRAVKYFSGNVCSEYPDENENTVSPLAPHLLQVRASQRNMSNKPSQSIVKTGQQNKNAQKL